jgi:hypothetical protein
MKNSLGVGGGESGTELAGNLTLNHHQVPSNGLWASSVADASSTSAGSNLFMEHLP